MCPRCRRRSSSNSSCYCARGRADVPPAPLPAQEADEYKLKHSTDIGADVAAAMEKQLAPSMAEHDVVKKMKAREPPSFQRTHARTDSNVRAQSIAMRAEALHGRKHNTAIRESKAAALVRPLPRCTHCCSSLLRV